MSDVFRLALIPARAGSKRLPRKNVVDFAGRPMLSWTVDAANASGLFNWVVVSTDDDKIATVAESCGAEVLRRGPELSNDAATLSQVAKDVLARWPYKVSELCLLLANCPLRTEEDIAAGYTCFVETRATAMLSVTSYGWTPPFRALSMQKGRLEPIFGDWIRKKGQEYPVAVCPSGAVYWVKPEALIQATDLYLPGIEGFTMPWHRAIDIDTHEDLDLALCIRYALDHGFEFGG